MHKLDFEKSHTYGTNKEGIELRVTLRFGQNIVSFPAQLDTGAAFCVLGIVEYEGKLYLSRYE